MLHLTVQYIHPPIPYRNFDWCVTDENYEPGSPEGYGSSIQEALESYLESFEMKHNEQLKEWTWK